MPTKLKSQSTTVCSGQGARSEAPADTLAPDTSRRDAAGRVPRAAGYHAVSLRCSARRFVSPAERGHQRKAGCHAGHSASSGARTRHECGFLARVAAGLGSLARRAIQRCCRDRSLAAAAARKLNEQSVFHLPSSILHRRSLPRMVHPLRMPLQLVLVEIHLSQIPRGVVLRAVVEVLRRRVAALAAG